MSIKVIGAGFGRTGTDSMREALTILGFGPCHHMKAVMADEENKQLWRAVSRGEQPDWDEIFAGYHSCVDWPSAHYWRDLIKHYPDAKVILTNRSPESWWNSFERTILKGIERSTDPESLGLALIANQVFEGSPHDKDKAVAIFQTNVKSVIETVPTDRLLVHNLGDGWEPLCAHLGVDVPDQEYPGLNSTAQFNELLNKM